MTPLVRKGLIVALLHVLMICSLGGKLLVDRATRPRVWARTGPVDPDSPLRGRYVQLRIESDSAASLPSAYGSQVTVMAKDGQLVFVPSTTETGLTAHLSTSQGRTVTVLDQPLAFFIPEHVPDPSRRGDGEELWVEVTIPRRGAPRPIRLGVMRAGAVTPLALD
jgi:hypothetical protein